MRTGFQGNIDRGEGDELFVSGLHGGDTIYLGMGFSV
jgi:hypothetical protein